MTQALAMRELLTRCGHEIVAVLVGGDAARPLPEFFTSAFDQPVVRLTSPGFHFRRARGVFLPATMWTLLKSLRGCRRSLAVIEETLRRTQPDLVINFLEPLMGVYKLLRSSKIPVLAVGHHFLIEHPSWLQVRQRRPQQWGMRGYVELVGYGATHLGLSFYRLPDEPQRRLFVSPPLLRRQVYGLNSVAAGQFLLVYLLNHGYRADIERWHRANPETELHCFYDRPGAPEAETPSPGLTFHPLHGEKFLTMMANCRAVVSTAGFESLAEAALLGKPVLAVPVENHVEQYLNACDAEKAGLAVHGRTFNLDLIRAVTAGDAQARFQQWAHQADAIVARVVERAVQGAVAHTEVPSTEAVEWESAPVPAER